ncbi:hypothetical protein [Acinetobacter sp. c1-l78]|uniref:hypothetical protein n=1 Tax=Acinetobacter sp. c1-l78 TaxID=3342803 RepID=UPI0035B6BAF7
MNKKLVLALGISTALAGVGLAGVTYADSKLKDIYQNPKMSHLKDFKTTKKILVSLAVRLNGKRKLL